MKCLYLCSYACLLGIIIFLAYAADNNMEFPFGGPTQRTIREFDETGNHDVLKRDSFHVGYMANNRYRQILSYIGVGVSVIGAVGWCAIRKAESSSQPMGRGPSESSDPAASNPSTSEQNPSSPTSNSI